MGNRTPDLYNAIVALSQLSYGPDNPTAGLGADAVAETNDSMGMEARKIMTPSD